MVAYQAKAENTLTEDIPFSSELVHTAQVLDDMSVEEFDAMMKKGLTDAKDGKSRLSKCVFQDLRQEILE